MDTEQDNTWHGFAGVRFGHSGAVYDYVAPFPVQVGDRVKVETTRGPGWTKATVAIILRDSEKARAKILEKIVENPDE
jgi:cell fate regulator YaaT (PSP1 superfamily)